jgi:hypothetical protein
MDNKNMLFVLVVAAFVVNGGATGRHFNLQKIAQSRSGNDVPAEE